MPEGSTARRAGEQSSTSTVEPDASPSQSNSIHAAAARTLARGLALYLSRPVRLFRPSKVSGWSMLKALAHKDGSHVSPRYLSSLIRQQGILIIPKHFIPPLIINTTLGTVLWSVYSLTSSRVESRLAGHDTIIAALSGAVAGGSQAVLAAPAENVRLMLEGGTAHGSWSQAWREVFRGTEAAYGSTGRKAQIRDARQIKAWMHEVQAMAGRGWVGWGWGVAKDMVGFAAFFAIFDVSRRLASSMGSRANEIMTGWQQGCDPGRDNLHTLTGRFTRGSILVTGGVVAGICYDFVGRPFDAIRKLSGSTRHPTDLPKWTNIGEKVLVRLRTRGIVSFFRHSESGRAGHLTTKTHALLRTLGRVGPWGCAFLIWETFGPETSSS